MLEMFNTTWLFEMSRGLNVNFFTFGDMVTPPQKHPLVQLCIHEAVEVVNNLRPPQMEKRPWNLKFFITRSGGICKESSIPHISVGAILEEEPQLKVVDVGVARSHQVDQIQVGVEIRHDLHLVDERGKLSDVQRVVDRFNSDLKIFDTWLKVNFCHVVKGMRVVVFKDLRTTHTFVSDPG